MSQFHLKGFLTSLTMVAGLATVSAQAESQSRIVTVGGAATEIVFALGAGDQVVAVDLSSTYPAEVHELPSVGYIRNISPEGVLSMRPDLVVTTESLGPPAAKKMLKQMSVPIIWCPEPNTVEALETGLREVGAKLGESARAETIINEVKASIAETQATSENWAKRPTVVFFLAPPSASGAGRAGGKGTRSSELIHLAGGKNAVDDFENFQPMSIESLIQVNPDVIFVGVSDSHGASPQSVEAMKKLPGLAGVTAVRTGAVYGVPMDDLSFGPRLGEAVNRWHAHLAESAK
ncbi:heme/hemin ABC transporter substrate-binding protein [Cerasicoccus arenae]|uniref:Fe/B12 periplasmic-binding domain-containing protein n=1 Tax=Cerasicoccus arenae TaxID=424488 RepID=A0A8J3DFE2_9BACT|nr:ABC transporter substrate-binding protein [Cerasicoccus arenae]MBK1859035.1 ABC transporter substrate-binding protein [Cerasicoccus arenae]GHB94865.1 hypothetical protein GCM10007047_08010 [Cerasicoccus arenae]